MMLAQTSPNKIFPRSPAASTGPAEGGEVTPNKIFPQSPAASAGPAEGSEAGGSSCSSHSLRCPAPSQQLWHRWAIPSSRRDARGFEEERSRREASSAEGAAAPEAASEARVRELLAAGPPQAPGFPCPAAPHVPALGRLHLANQALFSQLLSLQDPVGAAEGASEGPPAEPADEPADVDPRALLFRPRGAGPSGEGPLASLLGSGQATALVQALPADAVDAGGRGPLAGGPPEGIDALMQAVRVLASGGTAAAGGDVGSHIADAYMGATRSSGSAALPSSAPSAAPPSAQRPDVAARAVSLQILQSARAGSAEDVV